MEKITDQQILEIIEFTFNDIEEGWLNNKPEKVFNRYKAKFLTNKK